MPLDPADLLRRLEPAVRRAGPGPGRAPQPGVTDAGFGDLLSLVADGRVRSDAALTVAEDADLDPPLDDDQFARLASATDQAELAGARRAVMLVDARAIVVDVPERRVERELAAMDGPLTDLDAAVAVPPADPLGGPPTLGPPVVSPRADGFRPVARPPDD